jgi:hypothetical protein
MRGRACRHAGVDSAHGLQALRHRQPSNARTDHDHVRPVGSRQASNFDHRDIHPERLRIFISHAEFLANNGGAPEQQALWRPSRYPLLSARPSRRPARSPATTASWHATASGASWRARHCHHASKHL